MRTTVTAILFAGLLAAGEAAGAAPRLVDRAAESGVDFHHFNGATGKLYFSEMMGSGVALVDYDRDGDLDLYLVQGAPLDPDVEPADALFPPRHPLPLADRLYRNDTAPGAGGAPRLRFTDVTGPSGLASHGYGMGVATGDYDGDGWVDLYVTNAGPNVLLRNLGDGTFADVTAQTATGDRGWGVPALFVDFDDDGLLDLFVGNYVEYRIATDKECVSPTGARDYCGPLAYEGQTDRLYRNRGDGGFDDVTVRSGIASANPAGALGVVAADLDGDGRVDLYVANDQVPNHLWLNRGDGTFAEEAVLAGTAVNEQGQPEASMGVVAGDFDDDGDADLFISHLSRETNTLYLNQGGGLFLDATRDSGLGLPSWQATGFGVGLFDLDLDGRQDLFVANGAVRRIEELAAAGDPYPLDERNQLYRNLGGGRFREITDEVGGPLDLVEVSRGVAVGDLDNDGDDDLAVTQNGGPARLLVSEPEGVPPWLGVAAWTAAGAPWTGSQVELVLGEGPPRRRVAATGGSYASAGDPRVRFGLGDAAPLAVRLTRPGGGGVVELRSPPPGVYLVWPARSGG
ncbi:MAG: CRTAC1 family protein [Thermoanaerobaculia bacterium]|nr:CRTAC1 family protein [Thermoanaerobaculia bacterium]